MYTLKTEASFDAAHFLAGYSGKCSNIHGHRWRVVLTIRQKELSKDRQHRGMCVDFKELKNELKKAVDELDHTFIFEAGSLKPDTVKALEGEAFKLNIVDFRPTAENFSKYFYDMFKSKGYDVEMVDVYETPNNCASYYE